MQVMGIYTATGGRISLGIKINQKHRKPHAGKSCRQVHTGRGFADAALLIGYRNDSGCHWPGSDLVLWIEFMR